MTQENETMEPQEPLPRQTGVEQLASVLDPEPRVSQADSEYKSPPPQPKQKRDSKKIALLVSLVLLLGLSIAVYFMAKERTRALHDFDVRIAQLESRLQVFQEKQSVALAQSDRALESLKKDLQKLREQTGEHFAAEDRILQEIRGTRSATPLEGIPQNTLSPEQNAGQAVEPLQTHKAVPPGEFKPGRDQERSRDEQTFIDGVETVLKKTGEIAGDLFQKIWDWLSDVLKKTV